MKGELEWKVGKWAGVPVRPGIAHWERRERVEANEREVEEKEKGGTPTHVEGKGEGGRFITLFPFLLFKKEKSQKFL